MPGMGGSRFGPGVDDDVFPADLQRAVGGLHLDGFRGEETPLARVDVDEGVVGQFVVVPVAEQADQRGLRGDGFAVVGPLLVCGQRMPGSREGGAVDQGLGRDAADVDAGSPVHFVRAFDHGDAPLVLGQFGGEGLASFAEADDDGIILFHNFPYLGLRVSRALYYNAKVVTPRPRNNGRSAADVGENSRRANSVRKPPFTKVIKMRQGWSPAGRIAHIGDRSGDGKKRYAAKNAAYL